jgi:hypothetical protein
MGREMVPQTFPPAQQAAARYAKVFLRSIAVPFEGKGSAPRRKRRRASLAAA